MRGGSKAVSKKNIRVVAGKPLFVWSVLEAKKSEYIDRIIISTDDDEIMGVAHEYDFDVPFKRPVDLALDETETIDVVLHAIAAIEEKYDYVVLLQATSPLRTAGDIDACISMCVERDVSSVTSMSLVEKSPYWMFQVDENNHISPILAGENRPARRQDANDVYQLNGAVYVNKVSKLINDKRFVTDSTLAYLMPKESSIDIDTELDFVVLENLISDPTTKYMKR